MLFHIALLVLLACMSVESSPFRILSLLFHIAQTNMKVHKYKLELEKWEKRSKNEHSRTHAHTPSHFNQIDCVCVLKLSYELVPVHARAQWYLATESCLFLFIRFFHIFFFFFVHRQFIYCKLYNFSVWIKIENVEKWNFNCIHLMNEDDPLLQEAQNISFD